MQVFEQFNFQFALRIQVKNQPEKFSKIEILSSDRGSLTKVFSELIEKDETGLIRDIIQKALLQAGVNHNKN
jgi:hypothetical protein